MEWSRNVPIYVVTLARPELLERRPDWGAGKRSFTSIYLEPIADRGDARAARRPGARPAEPARGAIVARADGVPLYAVETIRMLLAEGRLVLEDGVYRPVGDLTTLAVPGDADRADRRPARRARCQPTGRSSSDAAVLGQSFTPAAVWPPCRAPTSRSSRASARWSGASCSTQQVDPRSPERGQYAFVQALIREVAYNTLAKRDRKVRHLAAARFFESLGSDELAGALAGHYLAAHANAPEGAEADALAAQARVALRAAAERAAALGAHEQAIAFLEHALAVNPEAADRADLHERALASAMEGLSQEVAERHGLGVVQARRELGDRQATALALARYALVFQFFGTDGEKILTVVRPAWEEFSDLEETPAGVALMNMMAAGHNFLQDNQTALERLERLLPIAERLDDLPELARGLQRLSGTLFRLDRHHESLFLLSGPTSPAVANGLVDIIRNTRTSLSFREQYADPAAGLAMAREGLEIASRTGSTNYGFHDGRQRDVMRAPGGGVGLGDRPARGVAVERDHGELLPRAVRRPGGADCAPRRRPVL